MPLDEEGNEYEDAPRHVWEEAIDEIRSKADPDAPDDVKKERARIIRWLLDGYKDRFKDPYPDKSDP